ncbi:MAG TPA: cysteine--tRNA ligase [Spirochaetia bacterium]|nr:cysteine--tRNA ligase [Spirochaetia bacterium]
MLHIYNSLTKKIEEIVPIHKGEIGMYACGPTVYGFTHIGHGRKYVTDDILRRTLEVIEELKVKHVQNVTDVGHLVSDADEGEDKMEKGAAAAGKTVWEVAQEYTDYFNKVMNELNILPPTVVCRATEHITDQIALIEKIIANGYGYDTPEAVYFDVTRFVDYGKMFNQSFEDKTVAARSEVETGLHKKHPADFVLWFKRVGKYRDHVMHWSSPWGDGFPGWHIECSAMSMKYLGEQFDIHTGGEDHLSIHHPNEIAQSEAGTGKKPFVKYWLHTTYLMVDGKKMSKSLDNLYKLTDLAEKGFSPLALRYYFLTTHYHKQMNFTWEGLAGAQKSLKNLNKMVVDLTDIPVTADGWSDEGEEFYKKFVEAMEDDLNTSSALAVVWEMMKSNISDSAKKNLIVVMDSVLGLNLGTEEEKNIGVPEEIKKMLAKREESRKEKNWAESDALRKQIEEMGYKVEDCADGVKVEKI